ncbi:hypothetical protein LAZ67_5001638 [Cordylochernes scorpioides]|uniref:Uncharacterized protein n=1 Tax=Cordylochernes scorpioides TaxID=51811 RepID=A0ABY6KKK2_9ARAC|nr:hypothetical protein LAZ67_5001638 [Cordylochernes scorpioides]
MEEEKKEHDAKIKKMEQEMEQVFELKVREKMQKLKDSEADLQRRHEQMKKSLEHQRHELEEKRRAFEKEKMTFETQHKDVEESFKRMTMDANSKEVTGHEEETGISKSLVGSIIKEDLQLKKTPSKFVPKMLTIQQKENRVEVAKKMLEMVEENPNWKEKVITGDETWVYGYDPETKRQSTEWKR